MQELLDDIAGSVEPLLSQGKVADYIPALACIDKNQFGMALFTTDGQSFSTGQANTGFSIQSISKVLGLTLAIDAHGRNLWQRVGLEPSSDRRYAPW